MLSYPLSILFVDDEIGIRLIAKKYLEQGDEFSVATAESAKEALRILASGEYHFDAIISDYQMPGMNGITFLNKIRSQYGKIPFIIYTGRVKKEAVIEAINIGADFVLLKREDLKSQWDELAEHIKSVVEKARSRESSSDESEDQSETRGHPYSPTYFFTISQDKGIILTGAHPVSENMSSINLQDIYGQSIETIFPTLFNIAPSDIYTKVAKGTVGPQSYEISYVNSHIKGVYSAQVFRTGPDAFAIEYTPIFLPKKDEIQDLKHQEVLTEIREISEELASIPSGSQTETVISHLLNQLTGVAGVVYLEYHPARQTLTITNLVLGPGAQDQIERILGKKIEDLSFVVGNDEYKTLIREIVRRKNTLTDISSGLISPFVSAAIQKQAGIDHFIRLSYVSGDTLFGTSLIAMKPGYPDPPDNLLQSFANIVAISLKRQELEDEINRYENIIQTLADKSPDEDLTSAFKKIHDATSLKKAQQEQIEEKERFKQITENMADMIGQCDAEGKYLYVSPSYERILGYPASELIGKYYYEYLHPDHKEKTIRDISAMLTGDIPFVRYRRRHRDGSYRWIESSGRLLSDPDGKITGFIINSRDITDRVSIEEALVRSKEKLNILSSITRHDIVNQLHALDAFCYLLSEKVENDSEATGYIDYMRVCCEKISQQINFTRDYQELGNNEPIWQNVEDIARMTAMDMLPETITLHVSTGNYELFADPMLMLVFFNLFDNARRHGEDITDITISFSQADGESQVIIEDNGGGVPDDQKEYIFEKGIGKNTGLGLFLCREILAITDLSIRENGTYGEGARFLITAPADRWRIGKQKVNGEET